MKFDFVAMFQTFSIITCDFHLAFSNLLLYTENLFSTDNNKYIIQTSSNYVRFDLNQESYIKMLMLHRSTAWMHRYTYDHAGFCW